MKLNKWGVFKQMMKAGMLICLVMAGLQLGSMYVKYKSDNPEGNIISFITHEDRTKYNPLYEKPPDDFIEKVSDYNKIVRTTWIAIFFFVMFEIFSYKEKPDEYWIQLLKDRMNKVKENE